MKKLSAKFLCVVLSLVVLLCALPFTVYANSTTYSVKDSDELKAAVDAINSAAAGNYTISLAADIEGDGFAIKNGNVTVTVIGNGNSLTCPVGQNVQAWDGAKVILGDGESELTLIGGVTNDNPGVVYVFGQGSSCIMNDKVTIKDNRTNNYFGGGVTVKGGTFHMYGGTIQNCGIDGGSVCYGGGVAVLSNGTFIMDDGVITECYVNSNYIDDWDPNHCFTAMGGGVFVTAGSVFTMNGGTISNCKATNFGGGVAMVMLDTDTNNSEFRKMGMGNPQSIVTINGGTITGNSADNGAGVFASGYFYSYAGGVAYTLPESGSTAQPGLYINGSTISNNKADDMGGGILIAMLRTAIKAQIHNAEIKNNTADNGAGIENFGYWTQMDIDGCTITGNTAVTKGGGIMLSTNSSGGYTNLKNTTITGNTSGDRGAGVYYDANSEIRISGADVIQNNEFNGKLNNLNVYSLDKPVKVIGELTGSQIGLSDPTLWNDDKEDIAADAVSTIRLTEGYKANNTSLIPADAFTSDHESWVVDYGEKKTEQGAEIGRTYTYTAEKYHNVIDVTDGGPIVIDGNKRHIRLKAVTPNLSKADNLVTIHDDMLERYENKYEYEGTNTWDLPVYYDKTSGMYVTLFVNGDSVVWILVGDRDEVFYMNFNNVDCWLYAGTSHQQFAQDGEIVYQYTGKNPKAELFTNPEYESTAQTVNLVEKTPLEFNGKDTLTLFERNDLGIITDKLEVKKSSEKVDIQYDTVTTDYTNEVRLVRKKPNYHINNDEIDDNYNNNDIFTSYVETAIGKEIKVGETIGSFYTIPEVKATESSSCPYIFKGWYYDPENDNDTHPVKFDTDKYTKDIYAHWIKVEGVEKADADEKELPQGYTQYGGFDLAGIQISEGIRDTNFSGHKKPGGLRFITSLSMDVVNKIKALQPGNNIEYGYVAATHTGWIDYHEGEGNKLQYVSETANGIITSGTEAKEKDYFDFASNINCTSKQCSSSGVVKEDHRNFGGYLLYTLVITYEGDGDAMRGTKVLARPYIHYTDANSLDRVAYSEYRGTNTIGGCYISYNEMQQ